MRIFGNIVDILLLFIRVHPLLWPKDRRRFADRFLSDGEDALRPKENVVRGDKDLPHHGKDVFRRGDCGLDDGEDLLNAEDYSLRNGKDVLSLRKDLFDHYKDLISRNKDLLDC
jgi:hypothetical protein